MLNLIKKNIVFILFGTAAVVYGWHVYATSKPCVDPIEYTIGTLDPRFGVSEAQLVKDLAQAGGIWDKAAGKQLFVYNPDAALAVNLVYDTRQQVTQQEQVLTSKISETKLSAAAAKQQYQSLQAQYKTASDAYTAELATFSKAQMAYNARVAYFNNHGGAPAKDYAELQATKATLQKQQQALEVKRQAVNQLAADANALIDQYNLLVDHINTNVRAINADGLAGTQFEEGVYVSDRAGKRIDIYQFDNQTTFIRVLAHELGHALGLDHNDNADSIMSPINSGTSLVASAEDLQALSALCAR